MNMKRFVFIACLSLLVVGTIRAQDDATSNLLNKINTLRRSLGVHEYALSGILTAAAQNHAVWMATTGNVSHQQTDGSTPRSRATRLGYPSGAVSENIYMGGFGTAETAWQWWLNSSIHYRGITNAAYTEVGIGTAQGEHGQAFVLVFGNPNGWGSGVPSSSRTASNNTTGGDSGASAPAAPPSFVVGIDNNGLLMHEIQAGDTLGDIAFLYGYGWDDLEFIRQINGLDEVSGRNLAVGTILLIPPFGNTYTPQPPEETPPAEPTVFVQVTPGPTENAIVIQSDALELQTPVSPDDLGLINTVPEPSATTTPAVVAAAPTEAQWMMMTMTPTPLVVANAPNDSNNPVLSQSSVDPAPANVVIEERKPVLLIFVLFAQTIIIVSGGYYFWKRGR